MQSKPSWLDTSTILRGVVGSEALGLSDGTGDTDELGICLEPIEEAVVVGEGFQQYVYRTAAERTGIADAPSQPGDLDLTVYGLRKFCRMACSGNPTIMLLFFLKGAANNAIGNKLQEMYPLFVSQRTGGAFLGYMQAQRQRLLGERGQKRCKRPDLEEKYGYDTKYAMHILRLGMQGVELLETGSLTLPMRPAERDYLLGVRAGAESLNDVLTKSGELEQQIKDLLDTSSLPKIAAVDAIEAWMQQRYLDWWKATQKHLRAKPDNTFEEYHPLNEAKGMAGAKE